MWKRTTQLSFLLMTIGMNSACGQDTFDEKVKSLYRNTVPLIKADELVTRQKENEDVLMLDVRTEEEYNTSHLSGASFIDYEGFSKNDVKNIPLDTEIVVYCAIGYRSERIGEKLQKLGFENVKNLYGGIFDWKNTDHAVVNSAGVETDSVHTYNEKWSKWLYKGVKIYE